MLQAEAEIHQRQPAASSPSTSESFTEMPASEVPVDAIYFKFGSFEYNLRFWLVFAPTLLVLMSFGGKLFLGVVVIGSMIAYVLDTVQNREGTFVALWVTVLSSVVALTVSGLGLLSVSMFNICLVYNMSLYCMSIGMWGSLQFRFIQEQYPRACLLLERMTFAVFPVASIVLLTWASVALYGIENASFCFMAVSIVCHYLYSLPLPSSFRTTADKERNTGEHMIQGRPEQAVMFVLLSFGPTFLHIGVYHHVFGSSSLRTVEVGLLSVLPLLYLCALEKKGSLNFIGFLGEEVVHLVHTVGVVVCVLLLVGLLEVRVVFYSYGHLVHIPPPYDVIAVTGVMYCVATLALAVFLGNLSRRIGQLIVTVLALGSAGGVCAVLGLSVFLYPFAFLSAVFFARFYFSLHLFDYLGFVAATCVPVFWYIHYHFMWMDFEFDPLPMSLYHVSLCMMLLFAVLLAVPGVFAVNKNLTVNAALMVACAVGLTIIEILLHEQFSGIYPYYFVVGTSALGIYVARRLLDQKLLTPNGSWALCVVYFSKLAIGLPPAVYGVPSVLFVLFAVSPIYLPRDARRDPMSMLEGAMHAFLIGLSLLMSRGPVVAHLLLQLHPPSAESDQMLFALVVLLYGVLCLPLSYRFFRHQPLVRQINAIALVTGACFVVLRPHIPLPSFLEVVVRPMGSDVSLEASTADGGLAAWFLIAAVVLACTTVSGVTPIPHNPLLRLIFASFLGACVGLYGCGALGVEKASLQILFNCIMVSFVVFVMFVLRPSISSHVYMPHLYALMYALLPVTFLVQNLVFPFAGQRRANAELAQSRLTLLALFCAIQLFLAVMFKLKLSAAIYSSKAAVSASKSQSEKVEWMPGIGNFATVTGFALSMYINLHYVHGNETAVFFLAPILLLLHKDARMFGWLTDEKRYFPVAACVSTFLAGGALYHVCLRQLLESLSLVTVSHVPHMPLLLLLKNLVILLATCPSLFLFTRFLWDYSKQSELLWMSLIPACIPAIAFGDYQTVRLLGVLGLAQSGLVLYYTRQIKMHGMRFI